jgi:hypothetical protein
VHIVDPLVDERWEALVACHPNASVFHHRGWLKTLSSTYGYRPFVVTFDSPAQPLSGGIALCDIKSWITGRRFVALPFSDHCAPLVNPDCDLSELGDWLQSEFRNSDWDYLEIRPLRWNRSLGISMAPASSFWVHSLDLTDSLEHIFARFHKDCIQRRIHHAQNEGISYEKGRSEILLEEFYRLMLITRRRHRLLPQPRAWFRNLLDCMGVNVEIRVARKNGVAIGAILSMSHQHTTVYKYGCSDERFHSIGTMPYLFWKLIEESKASGAEQVDFGRTDLENHGLTEFKDRFGTRRERLTYFRFSKGGPERRSAMRLLPGLRGLFSVMPGGLSSRIGALLYRHIG